MEHLLHAKGWGGTVDTSEEQTYKMPAFINVCSEERTATPGTCGWPPEPSGPGCVFLPHWLTPPSLWGWRQPPSSDQLFGASEAWAPAHIRIKLAGHLSSGAASGPSWNCFPGSRTAAVSEGTPLLTCCTPVCLSVCSLGNPTYDATKLLCTMVSIKMQTGERPGKHQVNTVFLHNLEQSLGIISWQETTFPK